MRRALPQLQKTLFLPRGRTALCLRRPGGIFPALQFTALLGLLRVLLHLLRPAAVQLCVKDPPENARPLRAFGIEDLAKVPLRDHRRLQKLRLVQPQQLLYPGRHLRRAVPALPARLLHQARLMRLRDPLVLLLLIGAQVFWAAAQGIALAPV